MKYRMMGKRKREFDLFRKKAKAKEETKKHGRKCAKF
jgi:hypothetical protein